MGGCKGGGAQPPRNAARRAAHHLRAVQPRSNHHVPKAFIICRQAYIIYNNGRGDPSPTDYTMRNIDVIKNIFPYSLGS